MKSLSLTRPLVIMMVGIPGAGKSQFAKQFSDIFGAPVCSLNRLRYELLNNPTFQPQEDEILKRVARYQVQELSKTGRTFIVDGACNSLDDRRKLSGIAKQNGYGTLVVWVQTDEPTARHRSLKPDKKHNQEFHQLMDPPAFENGTRRLQPPAKHENHVVISGKHTFTTQARTVLKKLAMRPEESAVQTQDQATPHIHDAYRAHQAPVHLKPPVRRVRIT